MRAIATRLLALAAAVAAGPARTAEPPLRVGLEAANPPFVAESDGKPVGFAVDLFRAIGARLHRDLAFTASPEHELVRDLAQHKLDVLAGPVAATPERAQTMLFTEGYLWTEYAFASAPEHALADLAALRGHSLAVVDGTVYADWAERHGSRDGFRPIKYENLSEALDAVRHGAADAVLDQKPALDAAPGLAVRLSLPETRTEGAAALPRNALELRADVEDALQCLKRDGTVARLAAQWLHATPDEDDLERLVLPGYGVPGLAGYDERKSTARC